MPLFFFVSGIMMKEKYLKLKFIPFLQRNFKSLTIPYLFFSLVSYLYWLFFSRNYGSDTFINPLKLLFGIIYGIGADQWMIHNSVLWFFLCLFNTHMIFHVLFSINKSVIRALIIILLSIVGHLSPLYMSFRFPGVLIFP